MKSKKHWRISDKRIAGLPCIESIYNQNEKFSQLPEEYEFTLQGKRGEIYEYDDRGRYRAIVTHSTTANRIAKFLKVRGNYRQGEEAVFQFEKDQLSVMVKFIEPYLDLDLAILHASNFNYLESEPTPSFDENDPLLGTPSISESLPKNPPKSSKKAG